MYNFIQNQKGKIPFKMVVLGLIIILVLTSLGILGWQKFGNKSIEQLSGNLMDIRIPVNYSQPLIVATFNNLLSITPVNAKNVKAVQLSENTIKYIDAYKNTDVEQIKYPNKLKESLILKSPNHPDRFEYKINIDDYLWEIDSNGDIIFKQKEYEDRFKIDEVKNGHIKATMNTDYTDGHPVIFKILAPFLIDAQGNESSKDYVRVEIEEDRLVLIPDKEWLNLHPYPIILDPTVETVPREQEKVIFGDENSDEFKPKMKLSKWGDETYISLEYEIDEQGMANLEGSKVKYQTNSCVDVEMYYNEPEEKSREDESSDLRKLEINPQGVEFDLILKTKPETNVFNYKLESKGLNFYYQAPLNQEDNPGADYCIETECFNDNGEIVAQRPENVVGSYAVYNQEKTGDYTQMGGKNYRAGKAFHIYRPKVYDANGDWTWGEMNINKDNSILSVVVNQDWLDNAVYPVVIDPTFGYYNEGVKGATAYSSMSNYIEGNPFSNTGLGTVDSITMYIKQGYYVYPKVELGIYHSNGSHVGHTVEWIVTASYDSWKTFNVDGSYSVESATYDLCWWQNNAFMWYGDSGGGAYKYKSDTYDGNWPSTWSPSSTGSYKISIYATYTAAPSNATPSISEAVDAPDPVVVGSNTTFTTTWADDDVDELGKVKICKTDSLTNQNCDGGFWATSTDFIAEGVVELTYTAQTEDVATSPNDYYAYVCDDEGACVASGTGTSGSFTVQAVTPAGDIKGYLKSGTIRLKGGTIKINLLKPNFKIVYAKQDFNY